MNGIFRKLIAVTHYPTLGIVRLMQWLGRQNGWDWVDDHVAFGAKPTRRNLCSLAEQGVGIRISTSSIRT